MTFNLRPDYINHASMAYPTSRLETANANDVIAIATIAVFLKVPETLLPKSLKTAYWTPSPPNVITVP